MDLTEENEAELMLLKERHDDPDTYMKRVITSNGMFDSPERVPIFDRNTDEAITPLSDVEKENVRKAFGKFDKKKTGSIKPNEIADVMRMAGQNPTLEQSERMIAEAEISGTGMLMLPDVIPILEKYWKNPIVFESELREACLAFDKKDMGTMNFEELKYALIKYGDQLDEDDAELMQKQFNATDGTVIVEELIKTLMPAEPEPKKTKKSGKKSAGSSAKKKLR